MLAARWPHHSWHAAQWLPADGGALLVHRGCIVVSLASYGHLSRHSVSSGHLFLGILCWHSSLFSREPLQVCELPFGKKQCLVFPAGAFLVAFKSLGFSLLLFPLGCCSYVSFRFTVNSEKGRDGLSFYVDTFEVPLMAIQSKKVREQHPVQQQ